MNISDKPSFMLDLQQLAEARTQLHYAIQPLAALISIPDEINGQEKSVGVGLSPDDGGYNEPYWYVTPYSYPEGRSNLPILDGGGFWHTENWVGAVLTASQFGEPRASVDQVNIFLKSAIAACKQLLA